MKKRLILMITILAVAVAFVPVTSFAAPKTVKMKSYGEVVKKKSTVYCAGETGLYKVKIKNKKAKKVKRLVKMDTYGWVSSFKVKGKYVYYLAGTNGTVSYICRVKKTGGKSKTLVGLNEMGDYAIKDKKIYYSYLGYNEKTGREYYKYRVMKLNGKSKKATTVRPKTTWKRSNVKGYRVIQKYKGRYVKEYLKTPKGTKYLGKKKVY